MSSTFFPFPLFPFGTSTSQKISTPHRARHKRCCNTLSGSVPINDNFGKHCLNNSSQEEKLLDEMILLGLPAQTYMCSQAASPAGRQLEVIGMTPKSSGWSPLFCKALRAIYPLPVVGRSASASARCSNSMCLAHLATVLAMRKVSLWLTLCGHRTLTKKTERKESFFFKGRMGGRHGEMLTTSCTEEN